MSVALFATVDISGCGRVAIVRNAGRRTALIALFVDLAGLGAIASIVKHLYWTN